MASQIYAHLRDSKYTHNAVPFIKQLNLIHPDKSNNFVETLRADSIPVYLPNGKSKSDNKTTPKLKVLLNKMAQNGFIELNSSDCNPALSLLPASRDFDLFEQADTKAAIWKISRFAYLHFEDGVFIFRSSKARCYLKIRSQELLSIIFQFQTPIPKNTLKFPASIRTQQEVIIAMLIRAKVILPCNEEGQTEDFFNPAHRQWDFHDLLFHSMSRLGRTEKEIGGSYRFKDVLPPQPALKANPWKANAIPLYKPNLTHLSYQDIPLTAAIETRRSIRQHSIIPLTLKEIGEFLYRTVRVRYQYGNEHGQFTSRPYPGGGANYESEFYLTINYCAGIERGFYYYDPLEHTLCLVKQPDEDMEGILVEAYQATANQCFPPVLITIASRFNRFNWKYSAMSYAAQLKNIGVIYQTMWLVATSMKIAACGLGIGNTERFSRMTGLDFMEEGSLGEFIIGRPLI